MKYRSIIAAMAFMVATPALAQAATYVVDPGVQFVSVAIPASEKVAKIELAKIGYGQPFAIVLKGTSSKVVWPSNMTWANGSVANLASSDEVVVSGFFDGKNYVVTYVWQR